MMVRFRASSMRVRRILLRIVQRSWARSRCWRIFGLTKEGFEAEGSELVYATLYQRPNGQRIWDLDWYIPAYVNGIEWSCCVRLDAQTGEILDCDAVTGGIG